MEQKTDKENAFADLLKISQAHRRSHGCGAYPFNDGAALIALSTASGAQRVIELGTAVGYTSCCFAAGSSVVQIDTIEMDAEHVSLAQKHIKHYGYEDRIHVHHGLFENVLPQFETGVYDIAFFDGFSPQWSYFVELKRLLKSGGILICANLGLGGDAQRIEQALLNFDEWIPQTRIEDGSTAVSVKR